MMPDRVNLFYPKGNEEALKGLSRGVSNYICIVKRSLLASLGMLALAWSLRQEDCVSSGDGDQFGLNLSEEDH